MSAPTIRDESLSFLRRAVERGAITAGELDKVRDFWRERDGYDLNPAWRAVPGYIQREAEANEIIKRAYA